MLEHTGNIHITRAIASCLDHSHNRMVLRQVTTEVVEILLHSRQIHLQGCGVGATLQQASKALETAVTATLQQDHRVCPALLREVLDKFVGRAIEGRASGEELLVRGDSVSNTNKVIDTCTTYRLGNATIELLLVHTALSDIGDDGHPTTTHRLQVQRIQGHNHRVDIGVIAVVDNHRVVNTLLQLKPHRDLSREDSAIDTIAQPTHKGRDV